MTQFVARSTRGKTLGVIAISVVFIAAGIYGFIHPESLHRGSPELTRPVSVLCFVLFSVVVAMSLRELFIVEPLIAFGPEGVRYRGWRKPMPWSAIESASIFQIRWYAPRYLILRYRNPGETKMRKLAAGVQGTDRSFDELLAAVEQFAPGLVTS